MAVGGDDFDFIAADFKLRAGECVTALFLSDCEDGFVDQSFEKCAGDGKRRVRCGRIGSFACGHSGKVRESVSGNSGKAEVRAAAAYGDPIVVFLLEGDG